MSEERKRDSLGFDDAARELIEHLESAARVTWDEQIRRERDDRASASPAQSALRHFRSEYDRMVTGKDN